MSSCYLTALLYHTASFVWAFAGIFTWQINVPCVHADFQSALLLHLKVLVKVFSSEAIETDWYLLLCDMCQDTVMLWVSNVQVH